MRDEGALVVIGCLGASAPDSGLILKCASLSVIQPTQLTGAGGEMHRFKRAEKRRRALGDSSPSTREETGCLFSK